MGLPFGRTRPSHLQRLHETPIYSGAVDLPFLCLGLPRLWACCSGVASHKFWYAMTATTDTMILSAMTDGL